MSSKMVEPVEEMTRRSRERNRLRLLAGILLMTRVVVHIHTTCRDLIKTSRRRRWPTRRTTNEGRGTSLELWGRPSCVYAEVC